jgi:hypothetical protein
MEKNATPSDGARALEECLEDLRPKAFTLDKSAAACTDPASLKAGALERFGELHVHAGREFINQWHSKYFSQVLPFVIPRMVSGPDYETETTKRWRRVYEDAPFVSSLEFTRGFPRRVEAQCRNDWLAVPIVRSVHFKYTAEHTMSTVTPYYGKRGTPQEGRANEYIKAAQNLLHHLWHGHTGTGIHRTPINGDTTRLPFAQGLTTRER